jgi:hypothetical protein
MLDKPLPLWYNKGTKRERYKTMKAIDFIKNNPDIKEWKVVAWILGKWQEVTLLEVITEKYGAKCYAYFVSQDRARGEVWIER